MSVFRFELVVLCLAVASVLIIIVLGAMQNKFTYDLQPAPAHIKGRPIRSIHAFVEPTPGVSRENDTKLQVAFPVPPTNKSHSLELEDAHPAQYNKPANGQWPARSTHAVVVKHTEGDRDSSSGKDSELRYLPTNSTLSHSALTSTTETMPINSLERRPFNGSTVFLPQVTRMSPTEATSGRRKNTISSEKQRSVRSTWVFHKAKSKRKVSLLLI